MKKGKMQNSAALFFSVLATAVICVGLIAVMAKLTLLGKIGEKGTEAWINIILMLSVILGGLICFKLSDKKPELCCLLHAVSLVFIITTAGLVLDGEFENAIFRIGALVAGEVLICTLSINTGKRRKRKNRRYR